MGHQIASLDICYSVLPEEPKIIYSDDPNFRIDLYHEIVEFAKIQLDKSLKLSPLIMHSLLQDFLILTANFSEPGRVNVCFNLILKCFSNHNEIPNSWLSLIRYNTNFLSTSGAPVTFQEDDILVELLNLLYSILIIFREFFENLVLKRFQI